MKSRNGFREKKKKSSIEHSEMSDYNKTSQLKVLMDEDEEKEEAEEVEKEEMREVKQQKEEEDEERKMKADVDETRTEPEFHTDVITP